MSYTKGTWEVSGGAHLKTNFYAITNIGIPEYEVEANARLIAAAPAMLEALRGMVAYIELCQEAGWEEMSEEEMQTARATIAAAESE